MRCALLLSILLAGCAEPQGPTAATMYPDAVDAAAVRWLELGNGLLPSCYQKLHEMRVRVAPLGTIRSECETDIGFACAGMSEHGYQIWVCRGPKCEESYLVRHEAGHMLTKCHTTKWDYKHSGPYF